MSPASAASLFPCSAASPFSFSADSALTVPVTVTLCPRCADSFTVLLRRPYVFPSSPVIEYSLGSSPFCKQPVTVVLPPAIFSCADAVGVTNALTANANANKIHNRTSFCIFNLLMIEGAQGQILDFIAGLQLGQSPPHTQSSSLQGDHRLPAQAHSRGGYPDLPPSCAPSFALENLCERYQ